MRGSASSVALSWSELGLIYFPVHHPADHSSRQMAAAEKAILPSARLPCPSCVAPVPARANTRSISANETRVGQLRPSIP